MRKASRRPGFTPPVAAAPDYTYISLLLAPGFAADDVEDDGSGKTRFRSLTVPRMDDADLEALVVAATRKRERARHGDLGETVAKLLESVAAGSDDAAATVITEAWRMLESPDDSDVRRGLIRLAALLATRQPPSEFVALHLAEMSDAPPDAGLVELLLQAAFGRLVREPDGAVVELDEHHLRWLSAQLLPGGTEPPSASRDAIAFLRLARFGLAWEPGDA